MNKVLIVDDKKANRDLLSAILNQVPNHYEIIEADSGPKALELVETEDPDIVLLDIRMEGMDGFEVCGRIKQQDKHRTLPVIFITALGEAEDVVKGLHAGGVDYITKPIVPEVVLARINVHLGLMTAQKNLIYKNEELQKNTNQMIQTQKMFALGELSSGIAHELTQPLNFINITCQSILRDIATQRLNMDEIKPSCEEIVQQIHRMAVIIHHMKLFTQVDLNRVKTSLDVNKLIEGVFMFLGEQFKENNIEVRKIYEDHLPKVMGYERDLQQACFNLISNARFAVENSNTKEKKIEIRTFKIEKTNEVAFEIKDNGMGIPNEIKEKIFQPFFTTKLPGTGTGMGLSVIYKIIKDHEGRVEVESELGQGALFRIILPAANHLTGNADTAVGG
ncbi:MAG: response regulator [Candidatus Omnitrophica bacterium]|nr:response regulator [Candidatus Omnitrophota bacterium]